MYARTTCTRRPSPVLPTPETARCAATAVRSYPEVPIYCPFEGAPPTNSYQGECHLCGRDARWKRFSVSKNPKFSDLRAGGPKVSANNRTVLSVAPGRILTVVLRRVIVYRFHCVSVYTCTFVTCILGIRKQRFAVTVVEFNTVLIKKLL